MKMVWVGMIVMLNACQLFTKTVYVPVEKKVQCLDEPPPDLAPWMADDIESGCPEPWEVCLRKQDVAALIQNLEKLYNRAREDWERCGPPPVLAPSSRPSP